MEAVGTGAPIPCQADYVAASSACMYTLFFGAQPVAPTTSQTFSVQNGLPLIISLQVLEVDLFTTRCGDPLLIATWPDEHD